MRAPPPSYIANFDSASAMARAVSRYLRGKDFAALGQGAYLKTLVPLANALPKKPREMLYAAGGYGESISPSATHKVDPERIARWIAGLYPARRYPAMVIGSSSGALVHLAAALGIPWLPQTFLVPVSQTEVHPDDAKHGLEAGRHAARRLLESHPDIQLHHMHDPNQDRLMLSLMTYFRIKRLTLGQAYTDFITSHLEPGATLFISECTRRWPTTRLGDRYVFQFGALGGATPDEFMHGSERVADYLRRYDSHRRQWDPPQPDGDSPEAEWGFEPRLREDILRLAEARGYRVVRVVFEEPEHLSPLVADLYRWWYRERGLPPNRLAVESFIMLEPWLALRTGSVPFWMKFNMEPSADWLERYLDNSEPYDEINLTLFTHGVECVGLPPIARWRALIGRARKRGAFLGVDEAEYPRDFAALSRYHTALQRLPSRYPIPGPLALSQLDDFLQAQGERYPVRWEGRLH